MPTFRGRVRPARPILAIAFVLAACTFPALETPIPSPSPSPTASLTPSPSASPSPSPTTTPAAAVPVFGAGEVVETTIDGLRVRDAPGTQRQIIAGLLPLAFELLVVMGPIPVDDLGWYLVADADAREPQFEEGWVAAGTEPDPFLVSTGRIAESSPFAASLAQTGPAEEGPIRVGEGDHAIRWIALDPERVRCSFGVSVAPAGGEPTPAIRATIGTGVDRGTLQPQSFAALGVRGEIFVSVDSDCAWALVIVRVAPQATPSASPAG